MSNPKTLTEMESAFCYNMAIGMIQSHAARSAGYKFPEVSAAHLLRKPAIIDRISKEQAKFEKTADMTRKKVIDGLKDAIDIARLQADANAMVSGWREIARICGYYAPETKQLNITVNGAAMLQQMENMTDDELAAAIIEGQFVKLDEEIADTPPALPSPDDDRSQEEAV